MKIILDQIEFDLPEPIFKVVAGALQTGKVKKALEISKNYWNFQVKFDDSLVEIELRFGRNKVNKIQCACGRSNQKHPCIHAWIAAYWYYREIASHKKDKKDKRDSSTADLDLSVYRQRELASLLKLCLKLDKHLVPWAEVMLTPSMSGPDLFRYVHEKLGHFEKQEGETSSTLLRTYREQLELVQQLYDNALDDYTEGHPEEAIFKLLALIFRCSQWIARFEKHNHKKMFLLLGNLHKAFEQLVRSLKAPDLLEKIIDITLREIEMQAYPVYHSEENLYSALLHIKTNQVTAKKIRSLLIQNLTTGKALSFMPDQSILSAIRILGDKEWKSLLKDEYIRNIPYHVWLAVMDKIAELNLMPELTQAISCIYDEVRYREVRLRAAETLLQEALKNGPSGQAAAFSRKFSVELSNQAMADSFFVLTGFQPEEIRHYILDYKNQHPGAKTGFIPELLAKNGLKEPLLKELLAEDDIEIIMRHDHILYRDYQASLSDKYLELAGRYLQEHAGHQAFEYIERIRKHLSSCGSRALASEFSDRIRNSFPERTNLLNIS